jgi:pyruvate ferredoxin oxidoreductase alpha subunit
MPKQIEGSRAVADAIARCRPEVICAYPITPQTHIVEALGGLGDHRPRGAPAVRDELRAIGQRLGFGVS